MDHSAISKRIKNIEGHLHGIGRMVGEKAYCIDIIKQIQAVQASLDKVARQILEDHLNTCVITAIRGDQPAERERVLGEIVEVFSANQR
jgi:DNA-binding FrmR family transcriptional regulator